MEAVVSLLKNFNFQDLIPSIGWYVFMLKFWCVVLVMAGPVALLVLGILYTKRPPETPDSFWAYKTRQTMSDRAIWDAAHEIAGKQWSKLGAVLCVAGGAVGFLCFVMPGGISAMIALIAVIVELVIVVASRANIDKQLKKL